MSIDTDAPKPRQVGMTSKELGTIEELLAQHAPKQEKQTQEKQELMDEIRKLVKPAGGKKAFEKDVVLDEMEEEMTRFQTKAELLEWAAANVFKRFDEAYANASQPENSAHLRRYSKLIPKIMEQCSQRFSDHNLAFSVFKYAKAHSMASFVLGCSTDTYRTLLQTTWDAHQDLASIHSIMTEMVANGVTIDRRTEALITQIQRDADDNQLWLDRGPDGEQIAMRQLSKISDLLLQLLSSAGFNRKMANTWKSRSTDDDSDFGVF